MAMAAGIPSARILTAYRKAWQQVRDENEATGMNSEADSQSVIETIELTKCFGDKPAVDRLSLRDAAWDDAGFHRSERAGKTTTIKMLMGMLRPDAGRARILCEDVLEERGATLDRVGYVPEMHHIYRWMRVRDVVGFWPRRVSKVERSTL